MPSMHWKTSRGLLFSWSGGKTPGSRAPDYRARQTGDGYTFTASHSYLVVFTRLFGDVRVHFRLLTSKDSCLFGNWL